MNIKDYAIPIAPIVIYPMELYIPPKKTKSRAGSTPYASKKKAGKKEKKRK